VKFSNPSPLTTSANAAANAAAIAAIGAGQSNFTRLIAHYPQGTIPAGSGGQITIPILASDNSVIFVYNTALFGNPSYTPGKLIIQDVTGGYVNDMVSHNVVGGFADDSLWTVPLMPLHHQNGAVQLDFITTSDTLDAYAYASTEQATPAYLCQGWTAGGYTGWDSPVSFKELDVSSLTLTAANTTLNIPPYLGSAILQVAARTAAVTSLVMQSFAADGTGWPTVERLNPVAVNSFLRITTVSNKTSQRLLLAGAGALVDVTMTLIPS